MMMLTSQKINLPHRKLIQISVKTATIKKVGHDPFSNRKVT
jgi:hypothetical protein